MKSYPSNTKPQAQQRNGTPPQKDRRLRAYAVWGSLWILPLLSLTVPCPTCLGA